MKQLITQILSAATEGIPESEIVAKVSQQMNVDTALVREVLHDMFGAGEVKTLPLVSQAGMPNVGEFLYTLPKKEAVKLMPDRNPNRKS